MTDEFLVDNLVIYIEKEFVGAFSSNSILDDFVDLKNMVYNSGKNIF